MRYETLQHLKDGDFKRLTGVQRETFDEMLQLVKRGLRDFGRPPSLSRADQLLMTLMYWREYRTEFHIAQSYGVSEATVCRTIRKVEDVLVSSKKFRLPGKKALQPSDTVFEESLALCKEIDEKTQMSAALLGLGLLDVAEDRSEARQHILHSLRLRRETGEKLSQTSSLIGVAVLAVREGDAEFAAQLLGAMESALRALGAVVEPDVRPVHTQTLAAAREQLGEVAFQSAWEEGSHWSLEEAVKRALA